MGTTISTWSVATRELAANTYAGLTRASCGVFVEQHATGILHCDLKPDNILLRDDNAADTAWEYTPARGFGAKGVEVIDYGCALDRNLYPMGTAFSGRRCACVCKGAAERRGCLIRSRPTLLSVCLSVCVLGNLTCGVCMRLCVHLCT